MRIPINWLKDYVKIPDKLDELTHKLTMVGHMLDKIDKQNGNAIIDLELRGNRADCYCLLGIAREISAIYNTPVKLPETYNIPKTGKLKSIKINTASGHLQRVMAVIISNIKITDSPKWLKSRLEEYGIPTINNIVDLSNYVMLETGQPLHTFDLDKIGNNLSIRLAKKGEKLTTFLGEIISLSDDDLVWANEKSILSVAGAVGGKDHSISQETKNVLLESASYNQANIRRTVHRHNLLTDAGIRHEKELDPNIVEFGIFRFLQLVKENKWGEISDEVFDYYPKPVKPLNLKLDFDYLDYMLGMHIEPKEAENILTRLNFKVIKKSDKSIEVSCPTYRTDVKLEEDLIEEIIRIYGYNKIPENVLSLEIPENITPGFINQEIEIKNNMLQIGFDEVISLPFVPAILQKFNVALTEKATPVTVINRPSPDLEEMQMTIYPNLVNFVNKIINERGEEARIFEVGKIYYQKNNKIFEKRVLGICYWKRVNTSYRKFKGYLDALFKLMRIDGVKYSPGELHSVKDYFQIVRKNDIFGSGGISENILFAEIYLDAILGKSEKARVELWPKYPPQIEDITLTLPERTRVGDLIQSIKSSDTRVCKAELCDIYKNAYTFRIHHQSPKKTLTNQDVEKVRKNLLRVVKQKYGAIQKE